MKSAILALAALGAAASPAFAKATPEKIIVAYGDLDLSSKAGQDMLKKRIKRAAREVCGLNEVQMGTRIQPRDANPCYREAKAKAETRMAAVLQDNRLGG